MSDFNTVNLLQQLREMAASAEGLTSNATGNGEEFASTLTNAINQVNDLNQHADSLKTRFEMGDTDVSLAEVMVASQKANLGFEATLRFRNKLVQAYQDIMNMPV